MRTHGNLVRWNEDRGFGFIAPAQGSGEIFVHISQFPRDRARPTPGELLSFETEAGPDGKTRAVRVMRAGQRRPVRRHDASDRRSDRKPGPIATVFAALALAAIGFFAYSTWYGRDVPATTQPAEVARTTAAPVDSPSPFSCDGRTMCSQMTSCAEATYFIRHCPDTKMDGNRDGVPCEQQWCDGFGE